MTKFFFSFYNPILICLCACTRVRECGWVGGCGLHVSKVLPQDQMKFGVTIQVSYNDKNYTT
jgi:hypothetical protein